MGASTGIVPGKIFADIVEDHPQERSGGGI